KSLSDMSKGFNRMMKYKKINKNLVGFMRATEVTVNNIDNSYNQHMHVLVCVESTYFYNTENYVNQKQWIQFWKRAMKLDYDPNVKVQMIRPKNKHKSDIKSAIDETAKYPVKDTDFMTDDEERNLQRLANLEKGLYRKRLISYDGLLKKIHMKMAFLLLQCGIGNGKIILLKSNSTKGPRLFKQNKTSLGVQFTHPLTYLLNNLELLKRDKNCSKLILFKSSIPACFKDLLNCVFVNIFLYSLLTHFITK